MGDRLKEVNYSEEKVPGYILPDPLLCNDGTRVADVFSWKAKRRPEILELFREHVYGHSFSLPVNTEFKITSSDKNALGGKAVRKEVSVYFSHRGGKYSMDILIYLSSGAKKPVPVFLGLNFFGNHTVCNDAGIKISCRWMRPDGKGIVNNRATGETRGINAGRWQVDKIIDGGCGLATIYYGDLEPDHPAGWRDGIRAFFHPQGKNAEFGPADWGAIGAWAWGLSRAMDYFVQDGDIDARRVIVMGHSRLGKTALWAGAQDERFAAAISNNSGCGGAALSRRRFGETLYHINNYFPHWFCENYKKYNDREDSLPVDQHELISLIAPRPLYAASAEEDLWADPRGEFLSAKHAEPVYALFGKPGLGVADMPPVNHPVGNFICYHVRSGKHNATSYDWEQYINFAGRHL
ncbi:MAG: acetylxylan esterase [Candidatus Omnitrophica bacterium]|nr:acetylxylan esterase [Candidatus Omnitrophota bacterium]